LVKSIDTGDNYRRIYILEHEQFIMKPSIIDGWYLEPIQKDRLYRYKKFIGQNVLTIDVDINEPIKSQKGLWGQIQNTQNIEHSIDIIYDPARDDWVSVVFDMPEKFLSIQRPGPRVDLKIDTVADLADFLVKLADEIMKTSWEAVRSRATLEF